MTKATTTSRESTRSSASNRRDLVVCGVALALVIILAAIIANSFAAGLWLDATLAAGFVAVVAFALTVWLTRQADRLTARQIPGLWMKASGLRILAVLAIGVALILLLERHAVATLAAAFAVYAVALIFETRIVRARLTTAEPDATTPAGRDASLAMEATP
ncbi:MAG: hypothetical protein ACF8PN_01785 [Phycisphaerales bacterium]